MYKLLIADDEQIVLDGIEFMIKDNFSDVQVVAKASSGREAIEACRQIVPDLIFMDIKMPGINGIEAIETIKKMHPNTKFVIISAYEQFEYAKQAVELGVSEYVLKPINQFKLCDVIKRIIGEIELERRQRQKEIQNKEKLEKVLPVLEHGFVYSLLLNAHYREELTKYLDLFDVHNEYGYIMVYEFGEGDKSDKLQNTIGTGIKGFSFYPKVQDAIKYKYKCIIGPLIINRITVLVFEEHMDNEYEQRIKAIHAAESVYEQIQEIADCNVYIGIGANYRLEKIKNSLEEALYALGRVKDEIILHVNDIVERDANEMDYSYVDIKSDEAQIITMIENGDENGLESMLNYFFQVTERKFQSFVDLKHIFTELMVMVLSCCYQNNLDENEVGYSTYLAELKRIEQKIELQQWTRNKVMYIMELVKNNRHQHVSNIVIRAKDHIDQHYNEEISLIDISKEVSVSPQYFSKIFKEEMGLSFVEYVRKKRVDMAKDMLRSKNYSVKEVCYLVGYNDPNYFSRLFKKLVGVSPTEFI